jgi:dolichyl-phosphate-mannose-protein mannosyltransferase
MTYLQRAIGREVVSDLRAQIPLIIYTILSLFTRLYRIGANNTVVWDEVRLRLQSRGGNH